jgi:hypothetical protein
MVLPVARTRDEAHLYMDLHPCPECGRIDMNWQSALVSDEGEPARRYWVTCPHDGREREFVFRLPERPMLPRPDSPVTFGSAQPSELLDAGEWLAVADLCAQAAEAAENQAAGPEPDADLAAGGKESLGIAVAALDEVLKFIPDGDDEVPAVAFWTDKGRGMREIGPDRFRRRRLTLVLDAYRYALSRA